MIRITLASLATVSLFFAAAARSPQGGDQFLDGIGETALVARYVFGGNAEDASRNQLHAALNGSGAEFVEDSRFRQVLLLTGDGSHVVLPGRALEGEDAMSVVGWLYLPTGASGPLFDFGRDSGNRLAAFASRSGLRAAVVTGGEVRGETSSGAVPENQWVHFGVVLDPASRALTLYVDGARAGQVTDVTASAADIGTTPASANRLFLGRAQEDGTPTLHARLRDVRIYRVVLADEQAATIRANALSVGQTARGRGRGERPVISTAAIP
ncbi:MAG TPA: LamG domain-containing protein, partial [Vicinamibacterales bacterium]|nr:LamG domain-containing protein [Vicinamibacterales bacterium]